MSTSAGDSSTIYQRPVELLQNLIRFDTTNPPGNEEECIKYIDTLLQSAGIQTTIVAQSANRPNLIARFPGRGDAPRLLLQGHVDVISTANQNWSHSPFAAEIADGYVWGRGALDMKGGVAMMLAAILRARAENLVPPGDIVFAALADEENFSNYGAKYIVAKHPELLAGVKYSISEFGGFTIYVGSRKFYMIQVDEKQNCVVRVTFRGRGGHSSVPERGGALTKLGRALVALERHPMPVHVVPAARMMFREMAAALPFPQNVVIRQLSNPKLADKALSLMGSRREIFEPLIRNTVTPTIVNAGTKINIIPNEAALAIHARLLPGYGPENLRSELLKVLGKEAEIELSDYEPRPSQLDMGMFPLLSSILSKLDPEGKAVPLLFTGITDARSFSRLGIQTYGFTPMPLPRELEFWRLTHGADERVPTESITFGTEAIYKLLQRFGEAR
jgi:acetylornithine deacetylase/succinyl-diaminopimelate desuccinylase-like protein